VKCDNSVQLTLCIIFRSVPMVIIKSVSHWWQIQCNSLCWIVQIFVYFIFLCFRLNYHNLEYLINFAESFTWKEFPTRNPETGILTMRGYITRIRSFTMFAWIFVTVFHVTQSSYRMLTSHSMILPTWYPFDASVSPMYEIANFTQVGLHLCYIQTRNSMAFEWRIN